VDSSAYEFAPNFREAFVRKSVAFFDETDDDIGGAWAKALTQSALLTIMSFTKAPIHDNLLKKMTRATLILLRPDGGWPMTVRWDDPSVGHKQADLPG
jgi:hypothetical protein